MRQNGTEGDGDSEKVDCWQVGVGRGPPGLARRSQAPAARSAPPWAPPLPPRGLQGA